MSYLCGCKILNIKFIKLLFNIHVAVFHLEKMPYFKMELFCVGFYQTLVRLLTILVIVILLCPISALHF
jgi:hypothetical protein